MKVKYKILLIISGLLFSMPCYAFSFLGESVFDGSQDSLQGSSFSYEYFIDNNSRVIIGETVEGDGSVVEAPIILNQDYNGQDYNGYESTINKTARPLNEKEILYLESIITDFKLEELRSYNIRVFKPNEESYDEEQVGAAFVEANTIVINDSLFNNNTLLGKIAFVKIIVHELTHIKDYQKSPEVFLQRQDLYYKVLVSIDYSEDFSFVEFKDNLNNFVRAWVEVEVSAEAEAIEFISDYINEKNIDLLKEVNNSQRRIGEVRKDGLGNTNLSENLFEDNRSCIETLYGVNGFTDIQGNVDKVKLFWGMFFGHLNTYLPSVVEQRLLLAQEEIGLIEKDEGGNWVIGIDNVGKVSIGNLLKPDIYNTPEVKLLFENIFGLPISDLQGELVDSGGVDTGTLTIYPHVFTDIEKSPAIWLQYYSDNTIDINYDFSNGDRWLGIIMDLNHPSYLTQHDKLKLSFKGDPDKFEFKVNGELIDIIKTLDGEYYFQIDELIFKIEIAINRNYIQDDSQEGSLKINFLPLNN
ncbi:MAG: hypothetical protein P9L98_00655 [Candidatus Kaelpia imicola]|nr:hypothetical protein [Candidatus Kaelpia imicola]